MQKIISYIIQLACLLLLASNLVAAPLDAPHDEANGIKCKNCHSYSTWWQYSPASIDTPTLSAAVNTACLSCHDGNNPNVQAVMVAHNSTNLSAAHGIWSTNCVDCHDPHFQAQLEWIGTYSDQIYLTTGSILTIANADGTVSYSYTDNTDGTTTIDIDTTATISKANWADPATWSRKNNNQSTNRGLLLVHGTTEAYNTYQITNASASQITVRGRFNSSAANAALDKSFGLIYGQMIKSSIMAATINVALPPAPKDVTFFDPNTANTIGGFTDTETPRKGICQVCHINTNYWTEDGNNDGHNSSTTCTNCHLTDQGFKPTGGHEDGDGTFAWDQKCTNCHQPQGSETILTDVHKIGTTNSCTLCHPTESGGSLDPATSAGNATVGSKPHTCTQCHIDSFSKHHATPQAQAGDCTWCHADPRQQWESYFAITGSKPRQLACRECHIKADGSGLTVYKLDFPVTPTDTITFPGNDLSLPPDNSKSVIQTVMDGANGTINHQINSATKINIYDFGACLSCHDGVTATGVNVWHARPKYAEIPADSSSDAYSMHFDTLRNAPGRSKFNLWRGINQTEPYFSHPNDFYDDGNTNAATRGETFFDSQNGYYFIEWNWGNTADSFSMSEIPCFRNTGLGNDSEGLCGANSSAPNEFVPVFDNGPTRDNINIISANYSNATLSIRAANTNGDLSITYDGVNYGIMNGSSGADWSGDIALPALTSTNVSIITSNPLGTNVLSYQICQDPITITSAQWDPLNGNTLTVQAQNIAGSAAALSVISYDGVDYPMQNIGSNQWQLVQSGVIYQADVTISNACDTVSSPVTDLTDSITITRAEWNPANKGAELLVWAENTSAPASLQIDYAGSLNNAMTWNAANARWETNLSAPEYALNARVHSNYFGNDTLSVVSLGEQIVFAQAQADSLNNTLSIQAINQQGNSVNVFAEYNGTTYPMNHISTNRWELIDQAVNTYADNVTIWSSGGGNLNILVNECTAQTWPPASNGSFLNAGVYWNRTDYNPDHLYVSVNIGIDGGLPKMILNGSGSSVEYPCTAGQLAGVYQCEVADNNLATAGYDNWLVLYSGAYPGDAAVINYNINDWTQDQSNIQPTQNSGNGLPICFAQSWDTITNASAVWDGTDLTITAINQWQDSSQVRAEYDAISYDLTWQPLTGSWQGNAYTVPFNPAITYTSEAGGYLSGSVSNINTDPDNITILSAGWNFGGGGELNISASNTYSALVLLTAHYNNTSSPMTWNGSNWQLLNISGINLPTDISITSNAAGGGDATLTPVADLTPTPYPPACDAGNGMDQILLPLNKSRFDPSGGDELHIDVNNVINLSYGAQFYMTYSETADGLTRYSMPWNKAFEFQYKELGHSWSPGATVTIWSKNDQGEIMEVACDQPVFNRDLSDVITIDQVEWDPTTETLLAWATNTSATAQLYADYDALIAQPLTWNSTANRWQLELNNVNYYNIIRIYSDANGDTNANVLDLYPDTISIQEAYWKADINQGNFFIHADNAQGQTNQLYADYGNQNGLVMAWDIDGEFWKLLVSQVDYAATVRVWSLRPGETSSVVNDMSGSHLNVSADNQCLTCHANTDIIFTIHQAKCDTCHSSPKPEVQNAISSGAGGSCITCHQAISTKVKITELSFNFSGSNAIALKDHDRPNSDIQVPVPEYVLDTRNEPAAYAKDSTIIIQVMFQADPTVTSAIIGSSLFAPQLVNFSGGSSAITTYTLPASASQTVGEQTLTIDWSYCDENGTNLPDCATPQLMHDSHHKLYITHNTPTAAAPFFTKLIAYSTKWSANALGEQAIVDNIYDGIWTLGAFGYKYQYPFLARTGTRVGDILRYQAGACGEWAAFMQRAIEVQGVDVYAVDIVPDQLDNMVMITESIGNGQETYLFGDHAFVVYGVPYVQSTAPTLGTAYDPSFHHTGPGWGGYEDVIIPYLEEKDIWYPNEGYGNGPQDDVLDTKLREVIDDFVIDESTL